MPLIDITYETALTRHPEAIEAIMAKLRKGKSKHKNASPDQLSWSYSCCTEISCTDDEDDKSLEVQIKSSVDSSLAALRGKIKNWWSAQPVYRGRNVRGAAHYGDCTHEPPPELVEWHRKNCEASKALDDKFNAMSEEERTAEASKLLAQLASSSGFAVVHIPVKND